MQLLYASESSSPILCCCKRIARLFARVVRSLRGALANDSCLPSAAYCFYYASQRGMTLPSRSHTALPPTPVKILHEQEADNCRKAFRRR